MIIYYFETVTSYGQFQCKSDKDALSFIKKDWLILYRESDTKNGLPFVELYYKKNQQND